MRPKIFLAAIVCLLGSVAAFGQGRGRQETAPAGDKVTPEIRGVVPAGTKIEVVKWGLQGADGGVGMPDGSIIVSANGGVAKVDADGNVTMLAEKTGQTAGLAVDAQGRVIAAQYTGKVSVLYPPESAKVLVDSYDGKPFIRPNDLVVDKKGGIYFTDCYQARSKTEAGRSAPGGLLHSREREDHASCHGHQSAERHHAEPRRENPVRQRLGWQLPGESMTCSPTEL